jgi:protocatechuate 3,4-dioxygenase beta subunit
MTEFAKKLEAEMEERGVKKLRVFLVYMNPAYQTAGREENLIIREKVKEWCEQQNLQHVAMVWIPSPVDEETAALYKINPDAKNTVFVYKKRKVAAKWVNVEYDSNLTNEILNML